MKGLIGKKLGMTQVFQEDGKVVPATVILVEPATVLVVRAGGKRGTPSAQVASGAVTEKHVSKPVRGQFKKAGVVPMRVIAEFALEGSEAPVPGQVIDISLFEGVKLVDVVGTSKGHGFSGTIKRHNFHRRPMTHGAKVHRGPGSLGAHTYPGRVWPGKKMSGHYGNAQITVRNLKIVKIEKDHNLLFLEGAVPGAINGQIIVRKA